MAQAAAIALEKKNPAQLEVGGICLIAGGAASVQSEALFDLRVLLILSLHIESLRTVGDHC